MVSDYNFAQVVARQVQALGKPGDIAAAASTMVAKAKYK